MLGMHWQEVRDAPASASSSANSSLSNLVPLWRVPIGHLLVPQRSSERCHPCQTLPGRVGTEGAHRDPRSARTVAFHPAWLLAFHVNQENLLMAIFRKCNWRLGVFFYRSTSDIFQATLDHGSMVCGLTGAKTGKYRFCEYSVGFI